MDVFPSILEHVLGKGDHLLGMQGKSIMSDARDPFVFSARINWSRAPYEFFLHDGKNKLICQLEKKKDVFNSKKIALISYKDADNQLLEIDDKNQIIQRYETAIKTLFDK